MSRYRNDDLAYGDIPQRWDRERFERLGARGSVPPPRRYEEDFHFHERDRPGRRDIDIAVMDRVESRGPRGGYEERDRFYEEERRAPSRPRRRTDRELFGDVDPRELADMQLVPRRKSISREDFDIDQRAPRPGLLRRQSSLDTFDRRPARYEREEYPIAPYVPVPLPIRRTRDAWDDDRHYREYERYYEPPEGYREVEIQRERSVHRRRVPKSEKSAKRSESSSSSSSSSASSVSKATSKATSKAPSKAPTKASTKKSKSRAPTIVSESSVTTLPPPPPPPAPATELVPIETVEETLIQESVREERKFKKGKTRMPKRLVRVEAIMDLGYPFAEEEHFYVLQIALEKEQIDEVIKISEQYKEGEKKKVYRYEKTVEETGVPPPPMGEHEMVERTEWINPPTIIDRRGSPSAKSSISQMPRSRSRRPSSPGTYVSKHETFIEAPAAPPPPPPPAPEYYEERKTVIEERAPAHSHHAGSLVLADRPHQSDRDINAEIRALEAERRALRLERDAEQKRDLAMRLRDPTRDEYSLVEYRDRSRSRGDLVVYEREKSPQRNVIRVEKDRKGRMALVRSSH
ncbi:unnamed protein product [Cercospora beticola]|nr:unnamed protein product [Cercospora beticola]